MDPTLFDAELLTLAKTIFTAVTSGNLWLAVAAALFLVDKLAVRFGSGRFPILKHPMVRLGLMCLGAFLGGVVNALAAGATMSTTLALSAAKIAAAAFVAGGGWDLLKKYVLPFVLSKFGAAGNTPEQRATESNAAGDAAAAKVTNLADAQKKLDGIK